MTPEQAIVILQWFKAYQEEADYTIQDISILKTQIIPALKEYRGDLYNNYLQIEIPIMETKLKEAEEEYYRVLNIEI